MNEQFVPAIIAQQLKEKGFDQSCMAYVYTGNTGTNVDQYVYGAISHDGNPRCENYNAYDMSYSLPLWQQVIDWLDKKEIFCSAEIMIEEGLFKWNPIIKKVVDYEEFKIKLNPRGTKIHALTDSIEHALTLI